MSNLFTASRCNDPGEVENAVKYGTNYRVNEEVTYVCNDKYEVVGLDTITCSANGQWEPAKPTCKGRYYEYTDFTHTFESL